MREYRQTEYSYEVARRLGLNPYNVEEYDNLLKVTLILEGIEGPVLADIVEQLRSIGIVV